MKLFISLITFMFITSSTYATIYIHTYKIKEKTAIYAESLNSSRNYKATKSGNIAVITNQDLKMKQMVSLQYASKKMERKFIAKLLPERFLNLIIILTKMLSFVC